MAGYRLRRLHRRELAREPQQGPRVTGEWMGFLKVSAQGAGLLKALLGKLEAEDKATFDDMKMPDLLRAVLREGHEVRVLYMTGHWLDVDSIEGVVMGGNF